MASPRGRVRRLLSFAACGTILATVAACGATATAMEESETAISAPPLAARAPAPSPPPDGTPPAAQPSRTAPAPDPDPDPDPDPPISCRSLDRCYTKAQMGQLVAQAGKLIEEFATAVYQDLPPPDYVLVESGTTVSACRSELGDSSFDYCMLDRTIYIGQEKLWLFYDRLGDAAAISGIAHEWGHHVQNIGAVLAPTFTKEIQADCIAGAWLAHMANIGRLEAGDLTDVDLLIRAISADETPDRKHGTQDERSAALTLGLRTGITACNQFTPLTPLTR